MKTSLPFLSPEASLSAQHSNILYEPEDRGMVTARDYRIDDNSKGYRIFKIVVLFFFLSILLSSCTTTPDINLRIPGTNMEITQPAQLTVKLAVSPKNNRVLVGSSRLFYSLWDISTGQKVRSFKVSSSGMYHDLRVSMGLFFFPDGTKALLKFRDTINIWDIETGRKLKEFPKTHWKGMAVSPDGKFALAIDPGIRRLSLLDLETGEIIRKLEGHSDSLLLGWIFSVAISPDGKYGISTGADATVRLWDIETGKELRRFIGHRKGVWSVEFSPDSRYALSGGQDKTLRLWDVETGKLIRTFRGHKDSIYHVAFSPNGKLALSGSYDATVRLWDISTGKTLKEFKGHSEGYTSGIGQPGVHGVGFTSDNKYALSTGDATLRVWDIASGLEVATMISFEDGEWLAITPEGYYNSSPNGHKYMQLLRGEKAYSMEQFYDVFYRPDIVAAKLRGEDISGLVTITMDDAINSPPPAVELTSKLTDTDQPKVNMCYRVKSTGGGIGEVRLFHNGKLIHSDGYYKVMAKSSSEKMQLAALNSRSIYEDMRAISIKGKEDIVPISSNPKGDVFEDCKVIETISGENEVSITAFNYNNTVQSYMKTNTFNSTVKPEEPHLYILSIGIDQYKDNAVNLKYAVKDAKDIEEKLKTQASTLYKPQNIHYELVTDKEATKSMINSKLNEFAQVIKPQDSFILFVAGHGVLLQNQYYMITHDYNGTVNYDSMIGSNEIVEMSKKIKSLSQLFIFDTCHAGGVDYIVSGLYDARMSVLAKKMGLHIYASASDKQAAIDGYKGNGLFSYTLLEGLNNNKEADRNNDGRIGLVELGGFSKQTTTNLSKKIGYSQTPLIINFGKDSPLYQLKED